MSHNHDERCFRDPHGCYLEAATRKDDPMTFVDRMAQLGQNRSDNATLLQEGGCVSRDSNLSPPHELRSQLTQEPEDAEFSDLALLDQPLLAVEEDGDHEHTGIPCRTCVALGLPGREVDRFSYEPTTSVQLDIARALEAHRQKGANACYCGWRPNIGEPSWEHHQHLMLRVLEVLGVRYE